MKKNTLLRIAFLIIFATGYFFNIIRHHQIITQPSAENKTVTAELAACHAVLPDADEFSRKQGNPPHYKAYSVSPETGKKTIAGLCFLTTDICPEIIGYSGRIKMMVGTNLDGAITGIRILSHSETRSYVTGLDNFLKQFNGRNINDSFQLGEGIDGITHATITSMAITSAIKKSLRKLTSSALALNIYPGTSIKNKINLDEILLPVAIFLLAIAGFILRNNKLRWLALITSLVYLGFVKATMFSVVQIANIGLLKFPPLSFPLWYALIGLTFVTLLIFGNIYCHSICPFAAVQEILYKISRKLKFRHIKLSRPLNKKACYGKYILLFAALIASFVSGDSNAGNIEPFIFLFTFNSSFTGCILTVLMLVMSMLHPRFWCKYFCPAGAFNNLVPKIKKSVPGDDTTSDAKQITRHTTFTVHDKTFIIILAMAYIFIAIIMVENIRAASPKQKSLQLLTAFEKNTVLPEKQKHKPGDYKADVKKIKDKLNRAGIIPREAKYWISVP